MYPYIPQNEDEMELVPGDFVFMSPVEQNNTSEGWLYATSLATGLSGLLPENYVGLADESDTWVLHGSVSTDHQRHATLCHNSKSCRSFA